MLCWRIVFSSSASAGLHTFWYQSFPSLRSQAQTWHMYVLTCTCISPPRCTHLLELFFLRKVYVFAIYLHHTYFRVHTLVKEDTQGGLSHVYVFTCQCISSLRCTHSVKLLFYCKMHMFSQYLCIRVIVTITRQLPPQDAGVPFFTYTLGSGDCALAVWW